jgi:hypothetical protein
MEEAFRIFADGPAGMIFAAVVVYMVLRKRRQQGEAQKEVQLALLNKFNSGDELTRFLATDEGRRLIDRLAAPPWAKDPAQRAVGMTIGGSVMVMMAIGLAVLVNYSPGQYHSYVVPAVISGSLGIGMLLGSALLNRLAGKKDSDREGDR